MQVKATTMDTQPVQCKEQAYTREFCGPIVDICLPSFLKLSHTLTGYDWVRLCSLMKVKLFV